ncbi:MAG: hypothetical protein HOO90_04285 [Methylotenera sp.]|uniref:hypothetical protein n=1 Tax=Methylotenera sp. TaxID=2051956 RepID=UPI0017AC301F|nr:hypothetical protein [Methylotenera sp.]NOU24737.1 hypothetical protein [Methylotenera sp.]
MTYLKIFANILTIAASLFLLVGLWFVFTRGQSLADLIAQVAFFYVAIAAFNKVVLGLPTLWHKL